MTLINSNPLVLENIKKIISKNNFNSRKITFFKADLRDENKLINIFNEHTNKESSISAVIHCAGLKSVNDSVRNPIDYWDNNVGGTLKLIKIMEDFKCNTIVFSSSATIYGIGNGGLINEDANINPINPYGQTKATIEKFFKDIFSRVTRDGKLQTLDILILQVRYSDRLENL